MEVIKVHIPPPVVTVRLLILLRVTGRNMCPVLREQLVEQVGPVKLVSKT